jgi:hypothetical protein
MYPHERSLVKKMEGKPFALIGINSDPDRDALKDVLKKEEITWRSFWDHDTGGPIATAWDIHGWPSLFLVDQKGIIRETSPQVLRNPDALDKAVEDLIKEGEGDKESPKK